jgi:tetrahydromethanopterin S-methyltransferase subunit D
MGIPVLEIEASYAIEAMHGPSTKRLLRAVAPMSVASTLAPIVAYRRFRR